MGICWKSFKMGLGPGLAGKPLPLAKKEPIAYLYNGVQLPALPEWDREGYPHAFIYQYVTADGVNYSKLYVIPEMTYQADTDWYLHFPSDKHSPYIKWSESDPIEAGDAWGTFISNSLNESVQVSGIIWANFDVLNEDGTVYLAATEPVPIYE